MRNNNKLEIIEFTDPVCTWCWASEPVLRALKARYGKQLDIAFIMSGLVKDIRAFDDADSSIGGDPTASNNQIAEHWLEASHHHGMPVTTDTLTLFSAEHPSSYPLNIAYKAAQLVDPMLADRFLRRMREATAVEAKQTNRTEVLLALAQEVGLDTEKLLTHFTNGTAQAAFDNDLAITKAYQVDLLPTFIVRCGEKEVVIQNHQSVESLEMAIRSVCEDELIATLPVASPETILQFIQSYQRVVPLEIMMAFSLDQATTWEIVHALEKDQLITLKKAGNGMFIDAL